MSNIYEPIDDGPEIPVVVEITLTISHETAVWLLQIAELHGDSPQNVAAQILADVARDDILAHAPTLN